MNVRGGILDEKSSGTSSRSSRSTRSLLLFRRKGTHKIWLMGVGEGSIWWWEVFLLIVPWMKFSKIWLTIVPVKYHVPVPQYFLEVPG